MGKIKREDVKVEVYGIEPYVNEQYAGIKLLWEGNIGFGEYEIYAKDKDKEQQFESVPDIFMYTKWNGQSEYMDSNDDKWFIKLLLNSLIEKMEIKE